MLIKKSYEYLVSETYIIPCFLVVEAIGVMYIIQITINCRRVANSYFAACCLKKIKPVRFDRAPKTLQSQQVQNNL